MKNLTKEEVKNILSSLLENKFINVWTRKNFLGEEEICFEIARDNYEINGVERQYREHISVLIRADGKMEFFPFGGCGGRHIYRNVDKTKEKEKYNALGHEDMPAIRIKDQKRAIEKICKDYINIVNDIKTRGLAR